MGEKTKKQKKIYRKIKRKKNNYRKKQAQISKNCFKKKRKQTKKKRNINGGTSPWVGCSLPSLLAKPPLGGFARRQIRSCSFQSCRKMLDKRGNQGTENFLLRNRSVV